MSYKTSILIALSVIFGLSAAAWALTSHKDYATMEIKDCNECHEASGVTFNHGSAWTEEHRLYADKKPNNCGDCHQLSDCLDCHTGGGIESDFHASNFGADYKPKSHRTDFREIHPIKAREDPNGCYRCHDERRFCAECHSKFDRNELAGVSHRRQFSDIRLSSVGPKHEVFTPDQCQNCHVKGVLPTHQWALSHAREARRNLASCQTCHPDGDVCMKCHSAQAGLMINPHPRDWRSIKGRLSRASDGRTCLRCHITVP